MQLEVGQRGMGCLHLCVYIHFFFFLVTIVCTPSMVYRFIEAATEQEKLKRGEESEEGGGLISIHDYGNTLCSE